MFDTSSYTLRARTGKRQGVNPVRFEESFRAALRSGQLPQLLRLPPPGGGPTKTERPESLHPD